MNQPVFLAATKLVFADKKQFNSFNTNNKSIRKSKKVTFSCKKAKLTPNLPSITRGPLREKWGALKRKLGEDVVKTD